MAEWLKALVSKTGIPFTGYRGFESPFFRKRERHRSFHCGAFAEDTSMYLLDSNPRALPDEPLVSGRYYERYPLDLGGEKMSDSFDFLRISREIVRIRLNDQQLANLSDIRTRLGDEEADRVQSDLLDKLLLYGTGVMMGMIP